MYLHSVDIRHDQKRLYISAQSDLHTSAVSCGMHMNTATKNVHIPRVAALAVEAAMPVDAPVDKLLTGNVAALLEGVISSSGGLHTELAVVESRALLPCAAVPARQ